MERKQREIKFTVDRQEQEVVYDWNQRFQLPSSVDRRSETVHCWVDHARENKKTELIPSSSQFVMSIKRESGTHQNRKVSTVGTSPRPSSPKQARGCDDQQIYFYQPTILFIDNTMANLAFPVARIFKKVAFISFGAVENYAWKAQNGGAIKN